MSAGGFLFFRETENDDLPGGMRAVFEPHRHYVPFGTGDLAEIVAKYTAESALADRVRERAAAVIRDGHTWAHRGREIVRDLQRL
jgi:hypothetical protein